MIGAMSVTTASTGTSTTATTSADTHAHTRADQRSFAMRLRTLIWMALPILAASFFAAHLFFGGDVEEQERLAALAAHQARITAATAEAGARDPLAMVRLGRLHLDGPAEARDPRAARRWFEQAAAQGSVAAQYRLGRLYEAGDGVRPDPHRAADWYRRAALMGRHREAQFRLGELFYHGRGVPHDVGRALDWFHRAAGRGHPVAQHVLGVIYERGGGVAGDPVQAFTWYTLAARDRATVLAHDPAYDPAAALERLRAGMTADQIKRARAAAEAFRPGP